MSRLLTFVGKHRTVPVERLFFAAPAGDGVTWWVHSPDARFVDVALPMEIRVPIGVEAKEFVKRSLAAKHSELLFS